MPSEEYITQTVRDIVTDHLGLDEKYDLSAKFGEDLGADSLDLIELTTAIEIEFDVNIPDSEVQRLDTPAKVVQYLIAATAQ